MRYYLMLNTIWIASLVVSFLGCEKTEDIQEDMLLELSGTWVELTQKKDTIDFDGWGAEDVFLLQRGFESREGSVVPKYGSGPYRFALRPDSILLNAMLSSSAEYSSYYFHMNASRDMFAIGNFYYQGLPSHVKIIFHKVK